MSNGFYDFFYIRLVSKLLYKINYKIIKLKNYKY